MSNKGKLAIAIILFILMLPAWGIVWVKDSLKDPEYCRNCHEDPYSITWETGSDFHALAHEHYQRGVGCQACHQRTLQQSAQEVINYVTGNYYYPFPETEISMQTCFNCHESYQKIIPMTTEAILDSERNPHDNHWGEMECTICHNMHRNQVDYCFGCHNRVAKSPDWVKPSEEMLK